MTASSNEIGNPAAFKPNQPATVHLKFSGATGRLTAPGRPSGFHVDVDPPQDPPLDVHRIDLNADGPGTLRVWLHHVPPGVAVRIAYGAGPNPYCNITDEAGMPLPAFAPIPAAPAD